MLDIVATLALHFSLVLTLAVLCRVAGHGALAFRPILVGLGCLAVYWLAIVLGAGLQDKVPLLAPLHWNWLGKVVAIGVSLGIVAVLPILTRSNVGLVWSFRPHAMRDAAIAIAVLCAVSWGAEAWAADGTDTSPERLLFQATMPGLDEELFMRGILLALFVQGFGTSKSRLGAPFGLAELAVTFLFAAGHALRFAQGAIQFDPVIFGLTGFLGAGLAWLRQRTGSLAVPVLAHNLINLGNSFF